MSRRLYYSWHISREERKKKIKDKEGERKRWREYRNNYSNLHSRSHVVKFSSLLLNGSSLNA